MTGKKRAGLGSLIRHPSSLSMKVACTLPFFLVAGCVEGEEGTVTIKKPLTNNNTSYYSVRTNVPMSSWTNH